MKANRVLALLTVLFLGFQVVAPAASLLVNGSFEADGSLDYPGSTQPSGWTLTGQRLIVAPRTSEGGTDGSYAVVLDNGLGSSTPASGTHSAAISQTFATTPGARYVVDLDYGWFAGGLSSQSQKLNVLVTGSVTLLNQTVTRSGTVPFTGFWGDRYAYSFIADSASTTLKLSDATDNGEIGNADGVLDRVEVITQPYLRRVINVDFDVESQPTGTYAASGVAPDGGKVWNGVNLGLRNTPAPPTMHNFTTNNLLDSTGAATSISLSLTGINQYDTSPDFGGTRIVRFGTALLDDFAYTLTTASFKLSGLMPGSDYDLYLYSQNGGYFSQGTAFTIGSQTLNTQNTPTSNFVMGVNYTMFHVLADGAGEINGTFAGNGGTLNGFQLVELPEPSPVVLLAVGSLLLGRRRTQAQKKGGAL